jgi:hypothetical protein
MPLFFGKSKSTTFKDVLEKVSGKIKGWRAKTLSQAGHTMLIKSVAASIPAYAMSSFVPSVTLWIEYSKKFGGVSQRISPEISL